MKNIKKKVLISIFAVALMLGSIYLLNPIENSIDKKKINDSIITNKMPEVSTIPVDYYQSLDFNKNYIYNVTKWDGYNNWTNYEGNYLGDARSNEGGQIWVNFSGFFDFNLNDTNNIPFKGDYFTPADKVPYLNISLKEKNGINFITNSTFLNISSSNVAHILGLGYNNFRPGFLIPIDNFEDLKQKAKKQNSEIGYEAEIEVIEYNEVIKFCFRQESKAQNTTIIFDKSTGLLVNAEVEKNNSDSDFKIFLDGYKINFSAYYEKLDFNNPYIYNVSTFGDQIPWNNFSGLANNFEGYFKSNEGGQIFIKFTGIYNKHENDSNIYDNPTPYYDVKSFEKISGLQQNFTKNNVSNGEASKNLFLGYKEIRSGFIIPTSDFDYSFGKIYSLIDYYDDLRFDLEETDNFFYLFFENINEFNNRSELIYDKTTGLLVWANISMGDYHFEINLINFSLNLEKIYCYDISRFGYPTMWFDLGFNFRDYWGTNDGGWIEINFTGHYLRDFSEAGPPLGYGWAFPDDLPRAWMNFKSVYHGYFNDFTTFEVNNISNREVSFSLNLGWHKFQPGILIPKMDNESLVKDKAYEAAEINQANLMIKETNLTMKFIYEIKGDGVYTSDQKTTLIYEKRTGLLHYADTEAGGFTLEMTIRDYEPWEEKKQSQITTSTSSNDDDDDDDNKEAIPAFPIFIILSTGIIAILILIFKEKKFLKMKL